MQSSSLLLCLCILPVLLALPDRNKRDLATTENPSDVSSTEPPSDTTTVATAEKRSEDDSGDTGTTDTSGGSTEGPLACGGAQMKDMGGSDSSGDSSGSSGGQDGSSGNQDGSSGNQDGSSNSGYINPYVYGRPMYPPWGGAGYGYKLKDPNPESPLLPGANNPQPDVENEQTSTQNTAFGEISAQDQEQTVQNNEHEEKLHETKLKKNMFTISLQIGLLGGDMFTRDEDGISNVNTQEDKDVDKFMQFLD